MYRAYLENLEETKRLLKEASELSKKCPISYTALSVGAIIKTQDGSEFTGYSREFWGSEHAEEVAIDKAIKAGRSLIWAILYCSLEPCSERKSRDVTCAQHIINHKFSRVFISEREGTEFVPDCQWVEILTRAGIEVTEIPLEK